MLKRVRKLAQGLCESFELPSEALGGSRLCAVGGKRMVVDNHRGIVSYSDSVIELMTNEGKVTIFGANLRIKAMTDSRILICGRIHSAEWCGWEK